MARGRGTATDRRLAALEAEAMTWEVLDDLEEAGKW